MPVTWEKHDDQAGAMMSACGRFEAIPDPVYGYFSLRLAEDGSTSLMEHTSLSSLARYAENLLQISGAGVSASDAGSGA